MTSDFPGSRAPRRLLASTTAIALVTGICALGAAHHLAQAVDVSGRRVAALPPGVVDPEVTGSIGPAARSIVLDPCNGKERLVVRGP